MFTAAFVLSAAAVASVADAQAAPLATLLSLGAGADGRPDALRVQARRGHRNPLHVFAPDTAPPGGLAPPAGRDDPSLT
jgi:hypothetical protein